jgi:lactoylglutathione lyase
VAQKTSRPKKTAKKPTPRTRTNAARTPRRPSRANRAATARTRQRRRQPETLRLREITPGFTVADLQKSIDFYTNVLGFMIEERWTDGDKLLGVMLRAGVSNIGLSQDDWAHGRDRKKGVGCRIWCRTAQDVDALAARVKAAGHALTQEPQDQAWGDRTFALDDPDGFHLTFFRSRS